GIANPLVVTLATPFIEVHQADLGRSPLLIRLSLMMFCISFFLIFEYLAMFLYFDRGIPFVPFQVNISASIELLGVLVSLFVLIIPLRRWQKWWIKGRAAARQNQVHALENATRLGQLMSAQQLLVLRAIDDEASLVLAFGAILHYVTARFIMSLFWLNVI